MKNAGATRNDYIEFPKRAVKKIRLNDFFKGINSAGDESVLSPYEATQSYNFDFSSGVLTEGYGIALSEIIPAQYKIASVWRFFKQDTLTGESREILMFATPQGEIYYVSGGINRLGGVTLLGNVSGINYRLYGEDVILICSDSQNMVVWNGKDSPFTVPNSPLIKSMAIHFSRMFVIDTEGMALRYSSDLDPTNWNNTTSEGGVIGLSGSRGRLNKLIGFLNYVYVFSDYGISRVSASGNNEFIATDLFVSGGKIYADTAVLCGDRVIFMASDGLYSFDGFNAKRILNNLKNSFTAPARTAAAYFNGRYYLACRLACGEEKIGCEIGNYVNNGLLSLDPVSGAYCLCRGMDISQFAVYNDTLIAVSGLVLGQVVKHAQNFSGPLKKKWRSGLTDLGSEKEKLLKEIHIDADGEILLTVNADGQEKSFTVNGDKKIKVNLKGLKLGFCIESTEPDVKVSRPVLIINE